MSKVCCPVCGGKIIYHRVDDGEYKIEVDNEEHDVSSPSIIELENFSDGSTDIYCSVDSSHKISPELWDEIITIVEDYGY